MHRVHTFRVAIGLAFVLGAGVSSARAQAPDPSGSTTTTSTTTATSPQDSLASLMRSTGGGPQTPITVLMSPAVQQELKLTEAQKAKVFNLSVSATQKQRDQIQSLMLSGTNNPQTMAAARAGLRRDNEQAIGQVLDSKQNERFGQIVLQAEGPLAVARPDIASKLRLNDNQKEYVQSIMMQMQRNQFLMFARVRQAAAMGQGQISPAQLSQMREMMARLRDEAVGQLGKVVDRKQKAAFKQMLGEPFDVSKLDSDASPAEPGTTAAASPKEKEESRTKDSPANGKAAKGSARRKSRTRTAAKP